MTYIQRHKKISEESKMAKLIFKYGVMNSGKTTTLLMVANDYERRGKRVIICKPAIDTKAETNYNQG